MVARAIILGQRGTLTIPQQLRRAFGLRDGSLLVLEQREDGILIRPARAVPLEPEQYSPQRIAEFLLANAVDAADYAKARAEVRRLGIDPDTVPHARPAGT